MTSGGWGDVTPCTDSGKIVACIVMVAGIGFFAILIDSIAQQFLAAEVLELEQDEQELVDQIRAISDRLRRLERH
jgi:hypothetical protein